MPRAADAVIDEQRQQNQARFLALRRIDCPIAAGMLVHGRNVVAVRDLERTHRYPSTDSLVTVSSQHLLTITVADCYPLFFVDPVRRAVGIAHAGWRGMAADICGATIEVMEKECGTRAEHLVLGIGPGIGACHFEVQSEVVDSFLRYPDAVQIRNDRSFVDLPVVATEQFLRRGGRKEQIVRDGTCAYCRQETYFSYRRDQTNPIEVMLAYIGLR